MYNKYKFILLKFKITIIIFSKNKYKYIKNKIKYKILFFKWMVGLMIFFSL